jgi:hypothetical protein
MVETTVWGTSASRAKKLWRCSSGKPSFQFVREGRSVARFCSTIGIADELSSSAGPRKGAHAHHLPNAGYKKPMGALRWACLSIHSTRSGAAGSGASSDGRLIGAA